MKASSRSLLALAALLTAAGVASAAAPPTPLLPARPPAGARSAAPAKLTTEASRALRRGCPGFRLAERNGAGWTCSGTAAIAAALAHKANDRYHWADRRTVYYGIGDRQIGAVYRPLNINMNGKQAQHGLALFVLSGPSIWAYWAAGCRRYSPDDRADCGDKSGKSPGWRRKYSTGWNFYPFGGRSKFRTIFTIDVYAKGYTDPNGVRGSFPFPRVVSGEYTCPRVGPGDTAASSPGTSSQLANP